MTHLCTGPIRAAAPGRRVELTTRRRRCPTCQRESELGGGYTDSAAEFRRLILPRLSCLPPSVLAEATGLSRGYVAQIREERRVPHVRHWGPSNSPVWPDDHSITSSPSVVVEAWVVLEPAATVSAATVGGALYTDCF